MNLNEYQDAAGKFQNPFAPKEERSAGLVEEVGEIFGIIKRLERQDYVYDNTVKDKMSKEFGDVLWYLSRLAADYDLTLEEIAEANIDKLADRAARNVLKGSGDNR